MKSNIYKNKKIIISCFCFMFIALFVFSSTVYAASLKSKITGKWEKEGGERKYTLRIDAWETIDVSIEFLKDGTVIVVEGKDFAAGNFNLIGNDRIKLDMGRLGIRVYNFSISKVQKRMNGKMLKLQMLTMKDPTGKVDEFIKITKRYQEAIKQEAEQKERIRRIKNTPIEFELWNRLRTAYKVWDKLKGSDLTPKGRKYAPPANFEKFGPEYINAGKELFDERKCANCHKIWGEGGSERYRSNRGPDLGTMQIGLYSPKYIKEEIVYPQGYPTPGFEDEKSVRSMPDYYGEDIEGMEMDLLLGYLRSLKSDRIPVEGKIGKQWTWWDDPDIITAGREIYFADCYKCHGVDGKSASAGDLSKLRKWKDEVRFVRMIDHSISIKKIMPLMSIWKVLTYVRTFSDPLSSRAKLKPIPPVSKLNTDFINEKQKIELLLDTFKKDKDYEIRGRVVYALSQIGDKRVVELFINALKDDNVIVRMKVADALGMIGDKQAVAPLINVLKNKHIDIVEDPEVRAAAANSLGIIRDKRAVKPLINALKDTFEDPEGRVRAAAAISLGGIGDKRAIEPLINALEDAMEDVRWNAAFALVGGIGDRRATKPIINMMNSMEDEAREELREELEDYLEGIETDLMLIIKGKKVFDEQRCENCHKIWGEGSSDRGPDLGVIQIGLKSPEYIWEEIIDPMLRQTPGFEDEKSRKAMPDYYGEDIVGEEKQALLAYMGTLKGKTK